MTEVKALTPEEKLKAKRERDAAAKRAKRAAAKMTAALAATPAGTENDSFPVPNTPMVVAVPDAIVPAGTDNFGVSPPSEYITASPLVTANLAQAEARVIATTEINKKPRRNAKAKITYPSHAIIVVTAAKNPRRQGSNKHKKFELMRACDGKSVAAYRGRGGSDVFLWRAVKSNHVRVLA